MDDTIWDMPYHMLLRTSVPLMQKLLQRLAAAKTKQEAVQIADQLYIVLYKLLDDLG